MDHTWVTEDAPRQHTVKPVFSGHSKRMTKLVIKADYCLMKVKSIAECSKISSCYRVGPEVARFFMLIRLYVRLRINLATRKDSSYYFF